MEGDASRRHQEAMSEAAAPLAGRDVMRQRRLRAGWRHGAAAPRPAARGGQLLLRGLPVRSRGDTRRGYVLRERRGGVPAGPSRAEHPAAAGERCGGAAGLGRRGGRVVVGTPRDGGENGVANARPFAVAVRATL